MKLGEVVAALELKAIGSVDPELAVDGVYTSDLLSDVMAHAHEADLLVTIQSHVNTIAVATVVDVHSIVFCNSRPVNDELIAAAQRESVQLFVTDMDQFTVSGKLYALLQRNAT